MRFAYIDSNGNEVPIPSVDALALRIELGAIADDTQLYDAQADQWAPAHSHEIYHSLSRSAGGDDGLGAPPPVASSPVAAEESEPVADLEEPELEAETPTDDELVGEDLGLTLAEAPEVEVGAEEMTPVEDSTDEADAMDFSLTDASPDVEEEPVASVGIDATHSDAPQATDDRGFGGMDLAPSEAPAGSLDSEGGPVGAGDGSDGPGDDEPAAFDFGGMEGGLEMEVEEPTSDAMDFGAEVDTGSPDLGAGGDFGAAEPTPDFSGGMELETGMEFDGGGFDASGGGSLDLEAPMSDFSPDAPPAWMEQDGPGGASGTEDVMDFSSVVAGAGETEGEAADPVSERRTPRSKPSAPKHRKQRNLAGPLVGIVILLAVGLGGWVAWPVLRASLAARGQPDAPAVYLPPISTELMPQMLSTGQTALAATFADVRGAWASPGRVQAPSQQWLAGVYLANASAYGQVEDFWDGMADLLAGFRGIDVAAFDAAYATSLAVEGVAEPDGGVIRERADSGFVAATASRVGVYDQVGVLIDAAQDLHQFLVANEASIEYVPAATATTDPVLEVQPANDQIRVAMEGLLDAVTGALSDLGYREAVSADGLAGAILANVQQVGIQ